MRAQSLNSLAGKLLRIDPLTGQGICEGSAYEVKNPFCDGDPNSVASRIYAVGFRNPFTMNVKPQASGESGPGVPYIGDVGEGGYEEVNAVTQPGQNFGWP
jgi:glucose/arabinose dehydrogenase